LQSPFIGLAHAGFTGIAFAEFTAKQRDDLQIVSGTGIKVFIVKAKRNQIVHLIPEYRKDNELIQ
jgi:hypothetical protein